MVVALHSDLPGGVATAGLGGPVRPGLEEQPGHLEPAVACCVMQGRLAVLVLRGPGRHSQPAGTNSLTVSDWNACQPEGAAAAGGTRWL